MAVVWLPKIAGRSEIVGAGIAVGAMGAAFPVALGRLFLSFLKIGSVVFGSGYVLLAFLPGRICRASALADR